MAPKKAFSQSQITRLSQYDLLQACKVWDVDHPSHALDLEIRAMLARAIAGGDRLCFCCSGANGLEQPKQPEQPEQPEQPKQPQQPEGNEKQKNGNPNPFEEFVSESPAAKGTTLQLA